jgi:DNA-binding FadR family transcriptional regulator
VFDAISARDPAAARDAMTRLVELALFDTRTAPQEEPSSGTGGQAAA